MEVNNMTITYEPVTYCPNCNNILDYFFTFSTKGVRCTTCGYEKEINTFTQEIAERNKHEK